MKFDPVQSTYIPPLPTPEGRTIQPETSHGWLSNFREKPHSNVRSLLWIRSNKECIVVIFVGSLGRKKLEEVKEWDLIMKVVLFDQALQSSIFQLGNLFALNFGQVGSNIEKSRFREWAKFSISNRTKSVEKFEDCYVVYLVNFCPLNACKF